MTGDLSAEMRDAVERILAVGNDGPDPTWEAFTAAVETLAQRCQRAEADLVTARTEIADRADTERSLVVELDKACTELDEARREAERYRNSTHQYCCGQFGYIPEGTSKHLFSWESAPPSTKEEGK